ncbi:hypothetical protein N7532_010861 [Penicillium argentinense]|uniref:Bacteriocin-protection protein n=1 Tax=Penicillium argentinense TaxID=1131581 RepID=A0A9W9EQN3_9EURO|nr:uncharacterized protein N7532_010861 [Penicillium argentinense]KAJ5086090.1 hypothetical protein N7532_010861 [Penicillium argentinense]
MSTKPLPSDLPIHSFPTAKDLEEFLEREHSTAPGFYLKLAKKNSGIPSVSAADAVETALCFGWIDGRANGLDQNWWLVRYTPRRAKSIWSQKNVNTIGRLIETGRMRPAGLVAVEAAKADGRWERAYAGPATITVPEDFTAILTEQPTAASFFESLDKSDRYSVLWRIQTASPTVRKKRIEALVAMLAKGKTPGTLKADSFVEKNISKDTSRGSRQREKTPIKKTVAKGTRKGLRSNKE